MTSSHSNRFYKKTISSQTYKKEKLLYSGHFGPKDFSIKQGVADHVINLKAIFKM